MTPERNIADIFARPVATVDDCAWVTTLSKGEIYAMAKTGELDSVRVGRRVLIRTSSLKALLGLDET